MGEDLSLDNDNTILQDRVMLKHRGRIMACKQLGFQTAQVQDEKDIISRTRLRDLITNQSKYMHCSKPLLKILYLI